MKRQTNMTAALLATFTALLVLGITAFAVVTILAVGSLGNVDCQKCNDLSGVFRTAWIVGTIGTLLAGTMFWGVFKTMRPRK